MRGTTALARLIGTGMVAVLGLASCSVTGPESADATSASSASSEGPAASTNATAATVPPEVHSLIEGVFAEWNSGDTQRWRATFTDEAVLTLVGVQAEYPIEIERDGYEFFAVLDNQLELIGCAPADVRDAIVCQAEATQRFADHLGVSPLRAELRFEFVDDLIVRYQSDFIGANSVRAAWVEFSHWIAERNPDDAAAMRAHPGDAAGARIALEYMDEYFETG